MTEEDKVFPQNELQKEIYEFWSVRGFEKVTAVLGNLNVSFHRKNPRYDSLGISYQYLEQFWDEARKDEREKCKKEIELLKSALDSQIRYSNKLEEKLHPHKEGESILVTRKKELTGASGKIKYFKFGFYITDEHIKMFKQGKTVLQHSIEKGEDVTVKLIPVCKGRIKCYKKMIDDNCILCNHYKKCYEEVMGADKNG